MRWVPDVTGRFGERPHYEPGELDKDCELIVEDILLKRHGKVDFPVLTEDLFFMLDQVACVDSYADFSPDEEEIWGESEFLSGEQPKVRIWRHLSEDLRYENPLRTTITHEYSHVHYHGPLFELAKAQAKYSGKATFEGWVCKREQVEGCGKRDWMEWQAGYCSSALLMPKRALQSAVAEFLASNQLKGGHVAKDTLEEIKLVTSVVERFAVSRAAASVRLRQLRYVENEFRSPGTGC